MKNTIRPMTALALTASLAACTLAIGQQNSAAQENPMPKQQKVPPMTGQEGGPTKTTMMKNGDAMMASGDMSAGMEADKTINTQLMKFAGMADQAGDQMFALMAGCGNMAEVEFSRAVAAKASDPQVKALAEMMVKDHSMAQEKLMPIGQKLDVMYPSQLPTTKRQELKFMTNLPVDKMEKAYLSMMKSDHLKTVNDYTDHIPMIMDADLKSYATETLAKVRGHTAEVLKVSAAKDMPVDLKFDSMGMNNGM